MSFATPHIATPLIELDSTPPRTFLEDTPPSFDVDSNVALDWTNNPSPCTQQPSCGGQFPDSLPLLPHYPTQLARTTGVNKFTFSNGEVTTLPWLPPPGSASPCSSPIRGVATGGPVGEQSTPQLARFEVFPQGAVLADWRAGSRGEAKVLSTPYPLPARSYSPPPHS